MKTTFWLIAFVAVLTQEMHGTDTHPLGVEEFYLVHQSRYLTATEIQAHRHIATAAAPLLIGNPLLDVSMIINGALGGLVPTHPLRDASPINYPFVYLVPLEHVATQVIQAVLNDIQVVGPIALREGSIVIGPKNEIVKLKINGEKLSTLYPGITFKGYDPAGKTAQTLREEITAEIKRSCIANGRVFVDLPNDMDLTNEAAQELMMAQPNNGEVYMYCLPGNREKELRTFYAENPCEYVKFSLEHTHQKKQEPRFITAYSNNNDSIKLEEEHIIQTLFGQTPKTDLEGVFKRYEYHLSLFGSLLGNNSYRRYCVDGTFEDDKFSHAFIAQVEKDWLATRTLFETKYKGSRLDEFVAHQAINIAWIKAFSFKDHQFSRRIYSIIEMFKELSRNDPGIAQQNIVGALLEIYPISNIQLACDFYFPWIGSLGGGTSTFSIERVKAYQPNTPVTAEDRKTRDFINRIATVLSTGLS